MTDISAQTQTARSVYATKDKLPEYKEAKFVTTQPPIRKKNVYNNLKKTVNDFFTPPHLYQITAQGLSK
jgi:hypothetical protein